MTREKALQIFGLEPGAAPDTDAIKKAYKRLAFKLHPDHNPTPTADDDFNALTNAFAVLTCAGQGGATVRRACLGAPSPTRSRHRMRGQD